MTKKLSIVFLIIIILFSFATTSFASDTSYSPYIEDLIEENSNLPYYVILQNPDTSEYFLIFSSNESAIWCGTDIVFGGFNNKNTKFYKFNGASWVKFNPTMYYDKNKREYCIEEMEGCHWYVFYNAYNEYDQLVVEWGEGSNSALKFSNYDIIDTDNDNQVFFQSTPLVGYLRTEVMPLAMDNVHLEDLRIPIVQIVVLTLVVVVSYLGLRKAWRLLSTLLRRCLII